MPVVPFTQGSAPAQVDPPKEPYVVMAAALMKRDNEAEAASAETPYTRNWTNLSPGEQQHLLDTVHRPQDEGERNKFDETLFGEGSVLIEDGAKTFIPDHNNFDRLNAEGNIKRYDIPNGPTLLFHSKGMS